MLRISVEEALLQIFDCRNALRKVVYRKWYAMPVVYAVGVRPV
jgi:hypothetical protein